MRVGLGGLREVLDWGFCERIIFGAHCEWAGSLGGGVETLMQGLTLCLNSHPRLLPFLSSIAILIVGGDAWSLLPVCIIRGVFCVCFCTPLTAANTLEDYPSHVKDKPSPENSDIK
jgi:hypothetical protein